MKLHCLGTTGYHPSPTRHTACYYLPDVGLVLDAGTGIFRIVEELLERPRESLTILLTHAHLDHVVGLTFLVDTLAVTPLKHIKLIGDGAKLNAVRKHLYHELLFPVEPEMEFQPLPGPAGSLEIGNAHGEVGMPRSTKITWFPLEHPGGSLGYCLEVAGKKLAYVTDTIARPDAAYLSHIEHTDLLLHECYFDDANRELAEKTGHSWLSGVTELVRKVRPTRTALIHINPLAEILGNGFKLTASHRQELKICVAEDGMKLAF